MTKVDKWLVVLSASLLLGCGKDTTTGSESEDMVTVVGTVLNADNGSIAQGVRVSLLDSDHRDEAPTGIDGRYVIRVPRGSRLYLVTDDYDAQQDSWFSLINIESRPIFADHDIDGLIIHACPNSAGQQSGSVAVWDTYLQREDGHNGDLFAATSASTANGIVSAVFLGCRDSAREFFGGFEVCANDQPFVYFDMDSTFVSGLTTDRVWHVHPGANQTDISGWAATFLDVDRENVELSIINRSNNPELMYASPLVVPTRPNMISMVTLVAIDGVADRSITEWFDCWR